MAAVASIRDATTAELAALEALQRRSSDVWEQYREALAANPDAIELPQGFIHSGWVRVAVDDKGAPIGFSVVIPGRGGAHELDGCSWNLHACRAASAKHWLRTPPRVRQLRAPSVSR